MEKRDVVIVGGGPAGYAAAIRVSQLGGKATLIEKDTLGGTCLNRGCIPTRSMARAVELIDIGRDAKNYGITYKEISFDYSRMIGRRDTVVKTLVAGVKLLLGGNNVDIIEGAARFASPDEINVELNDGTTKTIKARKVIIATGSRCKEVPFKEDFGKVINTSQIFELTSVPPSMLVVGAGFIGLTLATIFSKLGSSVNVIDESAVILPQIDNEVVDVLEKELKKVKARLFTESCIVDIEGADTDTIKVHVATKGKQFELNTHCLLMAEMREANIDGFGLERIGMTLNDLKGIAVNKKMETNIKDVFAAGDVTMEHMWTPAAYSEGIVAADNALGLDTEIDHGAIPYWISSVPEVAGVGLTEREAIAHGYTVRVGRFPFAANGMATILGERSGMVKMIVDEKYYQILGVHIVGPRAVDLIQEAALALRLEATPEDICRTLHIHPSLSEALWEASKDVSGEAIHFMSKR